VQTHVTKTVEFQNVKPIERPARSSLPPDWLDQEMQTAPTTEDNIPVAPTSRAKDRALLTMLTGLNAGQVFTLDQAETTIGRSKDAHVRVDEAGISRLHARVVRTEDGRFVAEDLHSTNGLFVNGTKVDRVDLGPSDRLQVGPNVVFRFGLLDVEEEQLARQLFESSTRDALTRAFNRKYLAERLSAEVAYAQRHHTNLSVILLDLDHFKRVNDTHGHQAGDAVLRVVAAQVSRLIRAEDVFARYGGEEFVVVVRGIAHPNVALFAERIRKAVEQLQIPVRDLRLRASVSLGVATLSECDGPSVESLLQLADERMYQAKVGGRNRVVS
jgi:two-component system, cell cycle response regulator